ncbi:MAG: type I-C CRISPR-associated protein Cas5 [Verrucomicrobia bacterium]|nr:MAG: type I-C CRISPR-associated protein Cas5 [Verrucomicrobiota bacterium]
MNRESHSTQIEYEVWGRYALFTDPITRVGGEKCSYHIPTYEAIKGITESIYWKPVFTWVIDEIRVMRPIRTEAKNIKPINISGGNTLATYTYLADVRYQVRAHFEWNLLREDLKSDQLAPKHLEIAKRMIRKGGRRDIFLGTRECQGYVEPCIFGEGKTQHQQYGELSYGTMFHGFDYPDTTGKKELSARFWNAKIETNSIIRFPRPDDQSLTRRVLRDMIPNPPASVVEEPHNQIS